MRMLIWKEIRENFKWAILAMLVLGMAEIHALYSTQYGQPDYYFYSGVTLCKTTFLTVTTFGCAIVGFLLGLIQILPELNRDRWAALLHRPVHRGLILRGKAAAGLFLYLFATVPPFLYAVWLAATPGHFSAPFVPGMVTPGAADICVGVVYYFAALALALERGGWIGLRVLPLLAAIHATYFILDEKLFYVAVEGIALMAIGLYLAAWGAIYNPELIRARPWLARFAFLAVVFYGACGLGNLAVSFIVTVGPSYHYKEAHYQLTEEGLLFRVASQDNVVVSVQDMDGKTPVDPKYKPDRIRNYFNYLNTFSEYIGDAHGYEPWHYKSSYRESTKYLWANNPYHYPRMEQWFKMVDQRYMIGYLPNKKEPFSILDQRGFQAATAVPEGFSADFQFNSIGQDKYYIWDSTGIRLAFMAKREMMDIVLPVPGPIYGMGNASSNDGNSYINLMGVVLKTAMAVYNNQGALVATLPYHHDMDRWGHLQLGLNDKGDRYYLWYEPSGWIDDKTKDSMPSYLEEMNAQGQVLHAYTLPPLHNPHYPLPLIVFLNERTQTPIFYYGLMVYRVIGGALGSKRLQDDIDWQFDKGLSVTKDISLYVISLSVLVAVITFFWTRYARFTWSRTLGWTLFVLVCSLPGFITFWLVADWPRYVACPHCGKGRTLEAHSCPHCSSGWPTPPATGIEIIDKPAVQNFSVTSV